MADDETIPWLGADEGKVGFLIDEYDLTGIGTELEERWTRADGGDSIRELAEYFNRQVLLAVMQEAGSDPLKSELDAIYSAASGDRDAPTLEIEVRERLDQFGLDLDEISDRLVSHQTIYNYLTDHREVTYDREIDPEEQLAAVNESVQKMKNRLSAVAASNVDSFSRAGIVSIGSFDVSSEVYVYCSDCGSRFSFEELVDGKGCGCDPSTDAP